MNTLYGEIYESILSLNIDDLIGQIFKLLPYKENGNENLDYYFSSILYRLTGLANLLNSDPSIITVISVLEAARTQSDFKLYRKAILDSCSILKKMQEKLDA